MRKVLFAVTISAFLLVPSVSLAQDSTSSGQTSSPSATPRVNQKNEALETATRNQAAVRAASLERLKQSRSEWEQKKVQLKADLAKIKDERKQKVVENLNERIAERNEKWVEHWNNVLKRLTDILDKIERKTTEAETQGKNTTSVKTAIVSARSAISIAQTKIDTQADKVYSLHVSSESTLGSDVSTVVNQFHTDVKAVIESINQARRAIQSVFSALKTVVGTASPSASPTASPLP